MWLVLSRRGLSACICGRCNAVRAGAWDMVIGVRGMDLIDRSIGLIGGRGGRDEMCFCGRIGFYGIWSIGLRGANGGLFWLHEHRLIELYSCATTYVA